MKLNKYLIILALETLLEQVNDAEYYKQASMIKDEIKKCLEAEGVTPEWIIGRYKTIADVADRDTDRLRSLESLSKIAGMFDTAEKKTEQLTVFAGFTPEQLEEVKNGKTQLLAHKERESES